MSKSLAYACPPQVYAAVARPFVIPALQGFNGTIFAYGVTSSGKTHTMMGSHSGPQQQHYEPGIVPLVIQDVFSEAAALSGTHSFTIRLSMMEIYNEVGLGIRRDLTSEKINPLCQIQDDLSPVPHVDSL